MMSDDSGGHTYEELPPFLLEEPGAKYDLEERLIDFAVEVIKTTYQFPEDEVGKYYASQLMRSVSSAALNYGEAKAPESLRDFIHKIKIVLKELRESLVALKIITRLEFAPERKIEKALVECNELVSIFVKSCSTAQKNLNNRSKKP